MFFVRTRASVQIILYVIGYLLFVRTPSKQKIPKKEEAVNNVMLLRGPDPKDYEKILRENNIEDYRDVQQAMGFLKKEKKVETGSVVRKI